MEALITLYDDGRKTATLWRDAETNVVYLEAFHVGPYSDYGPGFGEGGFD